MKAKVKMLINQTFLKGIGSSIETMLKIDQLMPSNDQIRQSLLLQIILFKGSKKAVMVYFESKSNMFTVDKS